MLAISQKSEIFVEQEEAGLLRSKGIAWSIHELLADSAYADRFKGGLFTHSSLTTYDYHRWHTPVQGRVLEAKVIRGQAYLNVAVGQMIVDGKKTNVLTARNGTDYQFVQTRGLVVIESPIGLVACVPMGMAQVSSVVITADVGVTLHKGEELGYFQFGGSDFVMVFERVEQRATGRPCGRPRKPGSLDRKRLSVPLTRFDELSTACEQIVRRMRGSVDLTRPLAAYTCAGNRREGPSHARTPSRLPGPLGLPPRRLRRMAGAARRADARLRPWPQPQQPRLRRVRRGDVEDAQGRSARTCPGAGAASG